MRNLINDARLTESSSKLEVVFDGSLTLWRTGANLDVLIVNHDDLKVIELIAYNPACNLEAPRIYINATKLNAFFKCGEEFERRLEEKKEFFIKCRQVFVISVLEKEVFSTMAVNYLTSRISQDKQAEEQFAVGFAIFLQPKFGDIQVDLPPQATQEAQLQQMESLSLKARSAIVGQAPDGSCLDVVMNQPSKLVPVVTEHYCRLRASLAQFRKESRFLQASNEKAVKLLTLAESAVTAFFPRYLRMNFNSARLRCVKAINRILTQNYSCKIRALLFKRQLSGLNALEVDRNSSSEGVTKSTSNGSLHSSPRGVSSLVVSPRGSKLPPINVHAAVTGMTGSAGGNRPKSRRALGQSR